MTAADFLVMRETGMKWCPTNTMSPGELSYGSRTRVWWNCEAGHRWRAAVYSVTEGSGCPYCAGKLAIPGETDLATTHPEAVKLWSPKNRTGPEQYMAGSHKKVWWRCQRGHEWEAVIASVVLEGCGCPYCAGKRTIPGETDLVTLRPEIALQWDPEKNGKLTPDQVLPAAHEKVWWRCELGHSYQAVVFARTREKGSGCPYCAGRKVLPGFNDLQTLRPQTAREWYQKLNGRLTPADVTLGSNKKVWWQCTDGHVWQAAVYSRTRKKAAGCPVCAGVTKQPKPQPEKKRRTAAYSQPSLSTRNA